MIRLGVISFGCCLSAWWLTAWIPEPARPALSFVAVAFLVAGLVLVILADHRPPCPVCEAREQLEAEWAAEDAADEAPARETTEQLVDRLERERIALERREHLERERAARVAALEAASAAERARALPVAEDHLDDLPLDEAGEQAALEAWDDEHALVGTPARGILLDAVTATGPDHTGALPLAEVDDPDTTGPIRVITDAILEDARLSATRLDVAPLFRDDLYR